MRQLSGGPVPPDHSGRRHGRRAHRRERRRDIGSYEYLLLMAACLLLTAPLEFVFAARVYRRPRALLLAVAPVVVLFSIWDIVAIRRGNWHYNPEFVTGLTIPGPLPIEELVFFVVIPICGLLTYESVGSVQRRLRERRNERA